VAFDPVDGIFAVALTATPNGIAKTLALRNTSEAPIMVTALAVSGTDAARYTIQGMPPVLPATVAPGAALDVSVHFMPGSTTATYSAALTATLGGGGNATARAGLYSLVLASANAEPTLDMVVKTLGYAVNLGSTTISLGTGATAIGDEVLIRRFVKAPGAAQVRLEPVGRYAPWEAAPYGYYTGAAPTPMRTMLGIMSRGAMDNVANRTLFPPLDAGGMLTFDPGTEPFGIYAESMANTAHIGNDARFYQDDSLNNDQGSTLPVHRFRVYPAKNRSGQPLPNTYLLACEEANNSDFQDYVFLISNVVPAPN
jgi:hypothetical protein